LVEEFHTDIVESYKDIKKTVFCKPEEYFYLTDLGETKMSLILPFETEAKK